MNDPQQQELWGIPMPKVSLLILMDTDIVPINTDVC